MKKSFTKPLLILFLSICFVLQAFNSFGFSAKRAGAEAKLEENYLESRNLSGKKPENNTTENLLPGKNETVLTEKDGRYLPAAFPAETTAPTSEIAMVGEITGLPGTPSDFIEKGNYLFLSGNISSDGYLQVYDITNIANPVLKSSQVFTGKTFRVLMLEGNFLYTVGDNGFLAFDISDPVNPLQVAYHNYVMDGTTKRYFRDGYSNIAKSGDLLFTNGSLWRLVVADISNLQAPVYKDGFEFNYDEVRDFDVLSPTELLLNDGSGLRSINFSDPSNLVIMKSTDAGYVDLPAQVEQLVVSSDKQTAYTYSWGASTSLISVIDIPSRTIVSTFDVSPYTDQLYKLALDETNTKLIAGGVVNFRVFDVSDRLNIQHISSFYPGEGKVKVCANHIFARGSSSSVVIYSLGQSTNTTPSISSFTPASGNVGTEVAIEGINFTGATAVKFNGTLATSFSVLSAASIKATVPAGATTGTISVVTPSGTAVSATNFTVTNTTLPSITSFTPTSGTEGTAVSITGTNFTGATKVSFNGTNATNFQVVSATSITAIVPAGATTGKISVTTAEGSGQSVANFTVGSGNAEEVKLVAEILDLPGWPTDYLAKEGYLFVAGYKLSDGYLQVYDISVPESPVLKFSKFYTEKKLQGIMLEGNLLYAVGANGLVVFDISNPVTPLELEHHPSVLEGTEPRYFTADHQNLAKTGNLLFTNGNRWRLNLTDLTNLQTPVFKDGFELDLEEVMDFDFVSATELLLNDGSGLRSVDFSDPSNLVLMQTTDERYVNITDQASQMILMPDKQTAFTYSSGTTSSFISVVDVPSRKVITTFDVKPYADQLFAFALHAPSKRLFAGTNGGFHVFDVSDRLNVQHLSNHYPGEGLVRVSGDLLFARNSSASVVIYSLGQFTNPAPTISSFSPYGGGEGANVSITGTNFTGATAVSFNGTKASSFEVISETSVKVTVPAGATTGKIFITTPAGTALSTTDFTVSKLPFVYSFSPSSGKEGTLVTITGSNFTGATAVAFNGKSTTSFEVISATSITATVPAGATSGKLTITNPEGSSQSTTNFTVLSASASSGSYLLSDIIPGRRGSQPTNMVKAGNMVFFTADEQLTENTFQRDGFYRTDGTDEGTVFIKSSHDRDEYDPYDAQNAVDFKGRLVFTGYTDNVHRLWISDGSSEGTDYVFSFPEGANPRFTHLTIFNNALYFAVNGADDVQGVYKWDGTNPPSKILGPAELANYEKISLLVGDSRLFCSDGYKIYDISADNAAIIYRQSEVNDQRKVGRLAYLNGKILLDQVSPTSAADKFYYGIIAFDPLTKQHFAVSTELGHGFPNPSKWSPGMASMGGALYFARKVYKNPDGYYQLWKINASFELSLVKEWKGVSTSLNGYFAANSHSVLFSMESTASGYDEIWKSDGTPEGTLPLIEAGDNIRISDMQTSIYLTDEKLFFAAEDESANLGRELWVSDFTKAGTKMAFDLNEGSGGGFFGDHMASLDGSSIIFAGYRKALNKTEPYGTELWVSDGSLFCDPVKPVITQSTANTGDIVLSSSSDSGNQWLKDGVAIEGAVAKTYTVTESGKYAVKVSEGACSSTSDEVELTITGIKELAEIGVRVYPNPSNGILTLELGQSSRKWEVRLMTLFGQQLSEQEGVESEKLQLDLKTVPSGLYMLMLYDGQQHYKTRIVKQ